MSKDKDCEYEKSKNKCMHSKKCLCPEKLTVKHKLTTQSLCCLNEARCNCLNCVGNAKVKCLKCCEKFDARSFECSGRAKIGCLECHENAKVDDLEVCECASIKSLECSCELKVKSHICADDLRIGDDLICSERMCVDCLRVKGQIKTQDLEAEWRLRTEKLLVQETMTAGCVNVCKNAKFDDLCYPRVFGQITSGGEPVSTTFVDNNEWVVVPVDFITNEPNGPGFTFSSPSELIYTGPTSRFAEVVASVTLTSVDVDSGTFDVAIFKNDVLVPGSIVSLELTGTDGIATNSTQINKILRLDTNDSLELYIRRTAGTAQVSVHFTMSAESLPNLVV